MQLYSHSRLSAYENCPKLFQFRYIDKIEVWLCASVVDEGATSPL